MFGTKEREINGQNIKFSEITERYISEAHIIIYVCDAVVPLKDSHVEIIRRIMRDYHKLDNTILLLTKWMKLVMTCWMSTTLIMVVR